MMAISIDADYRQRLLSGALQPDPAQEEIVLRLDVLKAALGRPKRRFGRREPPRGLYIHGGVGRGKSMLMDLFFAAAPVVAKRRVHFNAFMLEVHRRLNEARARREPDPLGRVAAALAGETRLLCFDEFQVRDVADAMILGRLFTSLIDHGVVVVATSNVAPENLYAGGLQRELFLPFIDLLRRRLDIVAVGAGVDHRLARLAGAQVWFSPDDGQARAEIDRLFAALTVGHAPEPITLDVAGRALAVPRAAARVARFGFDALCREALGAADYLALAAAFRVLVVEHIPRFEPEARNEAARFIALVDQLYEARVVLIASAAALPWELYPAGAYAFEFQRTASRLAEMGSAAYMAGPLVEKN